MQGEVGDVGVVRVVVYLYGGVVCYEGEEEVGVVYLVFFVVVGCDLMCQFLGVVVEICVECCFVFQIGLDVFMCVIVGDLICVWCGFGCYVGFVIGFVCGFDFCGCVCFDWYFCDVK